MTTTADTRIAVRHITADYASLIERAETEDLIVDPFACGCGGAVTFDAGDGRDDHILPEHEWTRMQAVADAVWAQGHCDAADAMRATMAYYYL